MQRPIIKIAFSILSMLVLIIAFSSCTKTTEPEYAGSITEGILMGLNENNYAKFSENFDEDMKTALPETSFGQLVITINAQTGDYVPGSKKFDKIITSGIYTDVFYIAEFTQGIELIVHISFHESDGKMFVNGFWLENP